MLRIQAPVTIIKCENTFTRYLQNFLLYSSLPSTCTYVHFKGLHQLENRDKTEKKPSCSYCSKQILNSFPSPQHPIRILFSAKSKWKAQQKKILHYFT